MDKITLERMEFFGYHGVFPEENKLGQRFFIDLVLYIDLAQAGRTDDLNETVSYAEIYQSAKEKVQGKPFKLIEALAESIASNLMETYTKINEITVRVIKPHPPFDIHFAGVTVEIHRKRA